MDIRIKGYPGLRPGWQPVTGSARSNPPYSCVMKVTGYRGDGGVLNGTAWLLNGTRLAVTAAHVVASANRIHCNLDDSGHGISPINCEIFPGYFGGDGTEKSGSTSDLAALALPDVLDRPGLDICEDASPEYVEAVGFPVTQGSMVNHRGSARRAGAYLEHRAHTYLGHSGGPILSGGQVCGLQLGDSQILRKWQQGIRIMWVDSNAALVFTEVHVEFLNRCSTTTL